LRSFAIAALLAAGCSATSQDSDTGTRPVPPQPATLTTSGKGAVIARIDGEYIDLFRALKPEGQRVELAPGKHVVLLRRAIGTAKAERLMWFLAQPGETYIAKSRVQGYGVLFWIEDSKGRAAASGSAYHSDEPTPGAIPK